MLCVEPPWLDGIERPSAPKRLPVVLTQEDVQRVFGYAAGTHLLLARLLFGTGMRITEALTQI